jgi:hypothetical protein
MANIVKLKRSGTANAAPTANSLEHGELAINYADGILFYKDSSNTIISFELNPSFSINDVATDLADLQVEVAMQVF